MIDEQDFTHMGKITGFRLYGRIRPENSPAEADVMLEVKTFQGKKLTLKCFAYETEPDDLHTGKLKIDDNVRIIFGLLNDVNNLVRGGQGRKYILNDTSVRQSAGGHYIVEGEILRIGPHSGEMSKYEKRVVLDCGIYLHASVKVDSDFTVGDYIKTNGRLDVHILGRVGYEK